MDGDGMDIRSKFLLIYSRNLQITHFEPLRGSFCLIGFFSIGETLASDYGVKRKSIRLTGCLAISSTYPADGLHLCIAHFLE